MWQQWKAVGIFVYNSLSLKVLTEVPDVTAAQLIPLASNVNYSVYNQNNATMLYIHTNRHALNSTI